MNLSQLETERVRYNRLVDRMKALKNLIEVDRKGHVIDAAHQALSLVNSPIGLLAVKTLVAAIIAEEVKDLATEGADFDQHDYFPEVTFCSCSRAEREEGAKDMVTVPPGAEGSIARALKFTGSVGGEYEVDAFGTLRFTVNRKQLDLPEVAYIRTPPADYKLAGDGKALQE